MDAGRHTRQPTKKSPQKERGRNKFATLLQQCLIGLTSGGFLGLIAVGYTLVYGTVGLIHFAHGDVVMLGGCLAVTLLALAGPLPLEPVAGGLLIVTVALCCGLFCGSLNVLIDRVIYRPLRQAPPIAPLVSAVINRLDMRRTTLLGLMITLFSLVIVATLDQTLRNLSVSAFLMGLGMAFRWISCDTWIVLLAKPSSRGRVIGFHESLMGLGIGMGPLTLVYGHSD
ncbi:MAG: MFS transporter, partial [Planctomycetia bacterium]|nr:MFS transporter [Planctomycetia bacterium]